MDLLKFIIQKLLKIYVRFEDCEKLLIVTGGLESSSFYRIAFLLVIVPFLH